jgi:hypothetical protein
MARQTPAALVIGVRATAMQLPARDLRRGDIIPHHGVNTAIDRAETIAGSTILELHDGSMHVLPASDTKWIIRNE